MIRLMLVACLVIVVLPSWGAMDYLLHGGPIHTADPELPLVEALVWSDGVIVARGAREDLQADYPEATEMDLEGRSVIPGLIDAHGHLWSLGFTLMRVDLTDTESTDEILQRLQRFESTLPEGAWLLGRGWDQNDWPVQEFPERGLLDQAFPERPVFLKRIDGHAAWANSAALAATDRRLDGDWQPQGGKILRDSRGQATGILIDAAMDLVQSVIPEPSKAEKLEAVERALNRAAELGLTGVHEAGTPLEYFKIYQDLARDGRMSLRIYAMADGSGEALDHLCRNGAVQDPSLRVTMRAVKFYADGALGSRGAALLEDYSDDPGNRGLLIQSEAALQQLVSRAMGCGLQVNIHAIGDRGNRVVLDALEQGMKDQPDHVGRHRIEHAQVLSPQDMPRLKELGLIASMQPTHATSDMYWAEDRLGPERIRGAYAWNRLLELDIPLALGSDFPVERPDPLLGLYAAVARQDLKGWPEGGWYSSQALSLDLALAGFTRWAAYAAFQEDSLGMLRPGYRADLVVLSSELSSVPAREIPETEVLATLVDGRPVYIHPSAPAALR